MCRCSSISWNQVTWGRDCLGRRCQSWQRLEWWLLSIYCILIVFKSNQNRNDKLSLWKEDGYPFLALLMNGQLFQYYNRCNNIKNDKFKRPYLPITKYLHPYSLPDPNTQLHSGDLSQHFILGGHPTIFQKRYHKVHHGSLLRHHPHHLAHHSYCNFIPRPFWSYHTLVYWK